MDFNFDEIDYAVLEAAGNVIDARANYRNKQYLIEDINNDELISEELYNEIINDDDIFQEVSVDSPFKNVPLDSDIYRRYRYDFMNHKLAFWGAQMRVAQYIVGIYQASHRAKGSSGQPIRDLIPDRTVNIEKIAHKLYDGKIEAMYDLIMYLKADVNGKSFAKIRTITGFDHTPALERDGEGVVSYGKIPGDLVSASFTVTLPKWPLTEQLCKCCVEIIRLEKYSKDDPKYEKQKQLVSDMMQYAMGKPYSSSNAKTLMSYTCFDKDKANRSYNKYIFAEHLRLSPRNKPHSNELVKKVSAMETTTEIATTNGESNNYSVIDQIAKQFGFKKAF